MIREKSAIRKQIAFAMDRKDYDTAQYYMNTLCEREVYPTRRKWTKDEEEFLINHVNALGLEKACEVVSKKLDRNKEAARAKYYAIVRKGGKRMIISPPVQKAVAECCHCENELYEGDDVIFDTEGSVYYCNDNCLADYIRKHPREFIEVMIDRDILEKTTVEG